MKANVIGKTLKKVGRDAVDYSLLTASYLTPFVPGDVQNYLEKRTGQKAEEQTTTSACTEFLAGLVTFIAGPVVTPYGVLAIFAGSAMAIDAVRRNHLAERGSATSSVVVELPYKFAKGTYNYLAGKYKGTYNYLARKYTEAELELSADSRGIEQKE